MTATVASEETIATLAAHVRDLEVERAELIERVNIYQGRLRLLRGKLSAARWTLAAARSTSAAGPWARSTPEGP